MTSSEMIKLLWDLANIVTGFSIVQSLGAAVALATDLGSLQAYGKDVKKRITAISVTVSLAHCAAVFWLYLLAADLEKNAALNSVWWYVTGGRIAAIVLFSAIFPFGLWAPEHFRKKSLTNDTPMSVAQGQGDLS